MNKIGFSIAVEPPPSNLPPELTEYLNRVVGQISSALLEAELQVVKLNKRVEELESAP